MAILTAKAYFSTRPETHSERVQCVEFTDALPKTGLDSVIVATLATFQSLVDAYDKARVANEAAATRLAKTAERVQETSTAFAEAIGRWLRKIDSENDRDEFGADALKPKFGDRTPSDFLRVGDWIKVAQMPVVFAHVDATPALVGSATTYQAVKDATDVLKGALGVHAAATTARTETSQALVKAEGAFDHTWGDLVRDLKRYAPAHATVPRFRRVRDAKAAAAEAPTTKAPTTEAPTTEAPTAPTEPPTT